MSELIPKIDGGFKKTGQRSMAPKLWLFFKTKRNYLAYLRGIYYYHSVQVLQKILCKLMKVG